MSSNLARPRTGFSTLQSFGALIPTPPSSNMFAWYDAAYAYKDAGSTLCSSSGSDTCQQLNDQSGNARHLTQGTSGNRPTWYSNELNSKPSLRFDGSNDFLSLGSLSQAQPITVAFVGYQDSWTAGRRFCGFSAASDFSIYQTNATPDIAQRSPTGPTNYDSGFTLSTWKLVFCVFNGASSFIKVSNNANTTNSSGTQGLDQIMLAAENSGLSPANIRYAEFLIYSAGYSASYGDGLAVRQYLNNKYNLGLTLPSPPSAPPSTSLWGWWDASYAYTDSGKTTLCSSSGSDTCYTLADLSGNSRDLIQSSSGSRPTWYSNQLNGKPCLNFDGNTDRLTYTGSISSPVVIYKVFKARSTPTDYTSIFSSGTGVSIDYRSSKIHATCSGSGYAESSTNNIGSYGLMMHQDKSGTSSSFLCMQNDSPLTYTDTYGISSNFSICNNANGTAGCPLDVVEMLIYTASHSSASGDGLLVRQYLNAKYNLGLSI